MTANKPTRALPVVFLTIFLDMLGLGILIPVFPMLFAPHSPERIVPADWSSAQGLILGGWLMAAYPIMQFFFAPILGQLADRYGRKKILAFSIAGSAISYAIFAWAILTHNMLIMFASRIFDGISGGNISVAQAVIGDISEPKHRARNFGLVGVSIGIGFILGPYLGGKLSDAGVVSWFNSSTPFWFSALLALVNAILVLAILPETLPFIKAGPIEIQRSLHNIIKALSLPALRSTIPAFFLFNAGFTFFTTFWGVVMAEDFHYGPGRIGNFFGYMGIMMVLAQGGLVRRLSGKVRDARVLPIFMLGTGLCLVPFYFIPNESPQWIYVLPPFLAVGMAMTRAFSMALLTRITGPEMRGEVMGINSSSNALAQAIPSVLAGYLAAEYARLPILVGAAFALLGWLYFVKSFKDLEHP